MGMLPSKNLIQIGGKIKTFTNKQKLLEFSTTNLVLQQLLKELFQVGNKYTKLKKKKVYKSLGTFDETYIKKLIFVMILIKMPVTFLSTLFVLIIVILTRICCTYFFFFKFLTVLHCMLDFSSQIRDQTSAPCSRSSEFSNY